MKIHVQLTIKESYDCLRIMNSKKQIVYLKASAFVCGQRPFFFHNYNKNSGIIYTLNKQTTSIDAHNNFHL